MAAGTRDRGRRCAACATTAAASTCTSRTGASSTSSATKHHPWNRGRLCVKARAAVDMVYHPDRILAPLKRTDGGWQEIPLEQALDEIAARLAEIEERHGARSVERVEGRGHRLRPAGGPRAPLRPRPRQPQLPLQRLDVLRGAVHRLHAGRRRPGRSPDLENAALHRLVGRQPALRAPQHDAVRHGRAAQGRDARRRRPAALGDRPPRGHPRRRAARHRRRPGLGPHPPAHRERAPTTRTSSSGTRSASPQVGRVRQGVHARGRGGARPGCRRPRSGPWRGRMAAAAPRVAALRRQRPRASRERRQQHPRRRHARRAARHPRPGGRHALQGAARRCATSPCTTSSR